MKASKITVGFLILALICFSIISSFSNKKISVSTGKVLNQKYTPFVSASGSLYLSDEDMLVTALIGEANISNIKVGQKAEVSGSGFEEEYSAEVINIGSSAKKVTVGGVKIVAVDVTLKIDKPDKALKSGFSAKLKIFTDSEKEMAVVPYSAVLQEDDREYVFVYENGNAQKTYIKTGKELPKGYEILSGIDKNDIIVMTPALINGNSAQVSVKPVEEQ